MKYVIVPVTAFAQNCTLAWCEETNTGVVIDPGGDVERILEAIDEQQIAIEKILLTHGHADHAGGAMELAEKLDVPIWGPQAEDAFWLDQVAQSGASYGFVGARDCTPDRWLDNGDSVPVGNEILDVYHCPGHTPGHIVFLNAQSRIANVGDVLFQGSIGRTDFPRGDHATLIRSIKETLLPLGDDITFIPGHGPASTFGAERKTNPFLQ